MTAFLLKHWAGVTIAALAVTLLGGAWGAMRAHDAEQRAIGARDVKIHALDSVIAANKQQTAKVDTLWRIDTLKLARVVARTDTLRDSVLKHVTDTLIVKEYIARSDSALRACSLVVDDCARFHSLAEQRFGAYEAKIKALETPAAKSRWTDGRLTIGPYAGVDIHGKGSLGVSGQLAVFRFP